MKKPGYYSTGELMKIAHITKKTVRYYDEANVLKPSLVDEKGFRYYTDTDLVKLQEILLLKSLGFSLKEIREMTIDDTNHHFMQDSLKLQLRLVQDRIEQLQVVAQAIEHTSQALEHQETVDWRRLMDLMNISGMEESLKNQYQNASNISARIDLHSLYSQNKQGWFPWIYEQCQIEKGMRILELGCGDGSFWRESWRQIPKDVQICLTDISDGMLRDARRAVGAEDSRFLFEVMDCQRMEKLIHSGAQYDLIVANHVLFYCHDIDSVCRQVKKLLKQGGVFICSTYGARHMREVSELVASFDDRIRLSSEKLYEVFGKENGARILSRWFEQVEWREYEDELLIPEAEQLIAYIMSCHGNQNQYILDRYQDFREFVKKQVGDGFFVSKEAGVFIVRNLC